MRRTLRGCHFVAEPGGSRWCLHEARIRAGSLACVVAIFPCISLDAPHLGAAHEKHAAEETEGRERARAAAACVLPCQEP
jgi:hypothetical protein